LHFLVSELSWFQNFSGFRTVNTVQKRTGFWDTQAHHPEHDKSKLNILHERKSALPIAFTVHSVFLSIVSISKDIKNLSMKDSEEADAAVAH